jgi:dienelactone hydrolase
VPYSHRREFDPGLDLVTTPVPKQAYRVATGTYRVDDGPEYRYDAYLPTAVPHGSPTVILVHGDGPPELLHEPRRWGQYRSWGALLAANNMAAIAFDHGSTAGRTRIEPVVAEIRQLIATVQRDGRHLGIDTARMCVWAGSAGVPFGIVAALDQPSVRCLAAFYGPMDLRSDGTRTAPDASVADLAEYSPITHLERRRGAIPPLFIAKAGLDRPGINDSIDGFVARAAELGSPVRLETHRTGRHAFDVLDEDDRSREIIEASVRFMRAHLA